MYECSFKGHQLGQEEVEKGMSRHTLGQTLIAGPSIKLSDQTGVVDDLLLAGYFYSLWHLICEKKRVHGESKKQNKKMPEEKIETITVSHQYYFQRDLNMDLTQ